MESPIGFMTLYEAVDTVGRALFGASWQYAILLNPHVGNDPHERVTTVIAEGCEAGKIVAAYRSIMGADELDRRVWQMPHWRNFFVTGMIDLELPLLDERLQPVRDGRTARCTREIFVRRDSLNHFADELEALNLPEKPPSDRGGLASNRPSRGPKAGTSIRVADEMRRDLTAGRTTAERLRSEPEKALSSKYGASRDTVRKVRNVVLSKPVETPK
jgi:hypothetical protein